MAERWVGMVVGGSSVTIVDAEVPAGGPIVVQTDHTMKLPTGPRERAYDLLHQQCANYLRENAIDRVVIQGSAVVRSGVGLAHMESAEVRGVVMAAAASVCPTQTLTKAHISKSFGERGKGFDEYVADAAFWEKETEGKDIRAGSRKAALLILAARSE